MEQQYVCNCCLVTKQEIEEAVKDGARTVEELKNQTMATSGCGKCRYMCQLIIDNLIKEL